MRSQSCGTSRGRDAGTVRLLHARTKCQTAEKMRPGKLQEGLLYHKDKDIGVPRF